jgi:23S rRNA pseudouridine1911/1915/1917 synthase
MDNRQNRSRGKGRGESAGGTRGGRTEDVGRSRNARAGSARTEAAGGGNGRTTNAGGSRNARTEAAGGGNGRAGNAGAGRSARTEAAGGGNGRAGSAGGGRSARTEAAGSGSGRAASAGGGRSARTEAAGGGNGRAGSAGGGRNARTEAVGGGNARTGSAGGGRNPQAGRHAGHMREEPGHVKSGKAQPPAERPVRPQPKAKQFTVQEPIELLPFLLQHLNEGRNSVKSILARGQVSVGNNTVTAYNYPLQPGMTVSVSKEKIKEKPPLIGLVILHEDEDVIVVLKEAGLLSIASDKAPDELTAYRQLMEHVRNENPRNRIFIVHRLDRDTSGVMMFAKSEEMQQKLQTTWQDTVRERTYVALVEGKVKKPEETITSWLKESKTLKMYSSPYPNDGQQAITHYRTLQTNAYFSLLEVELETGRKNQIRAHMEHIGHPVVGDKKYGSRTSPIGRLGLHAKVLTFVHPRTGQTMRFETDVPKLFLRVFREE